MKTIALLPGIVAGAALLGAPASHSVAAAAQSTPYAVVERGLHHRVWERTEYVRSPSGRDVPRVHRYVELATGLHRLENGQFVDAVLATIS